MKFSRGKIFLFLFLIIVLCIRYDSYCGENKINSKKDLFEKRYQAWKEWAKNNPHRASFIGNQEYNDLINLGLPVLPLLVEKIDKNPSDFHLIFAVYRISKKYFRKDEWPEGKIGGTKAKAKKYIQWWKEGRHKTPEEFNVLYKKWKKGKKENDKESSRENYKGIMNLGVFAIPCIINKIKEGDLDLIPALSYLTDGNISYQIGGLIDKEAIAKKCVDWWSKRKDVYFNF